MFKTLKMVTNMIAKAYHKNPENMNPEYKKALEDAYKAIENLKKFF